jgi:hypothetical protein
MAAVENNNKNVFVSPRNLVELGLGLLRQNLVLGNLVWKNPITDWTGRVNDTVNIRIPGRTAARHYSADGNQAWRPNQDIGPDTNVLPSTGQDVYHNARGLRPSIVVDTLSETTISAAIDDVVYNAIGVTDEQMTLDVQDFGRQVVAPQVRAMAEIVDAKVATLLATAPYQTGQSGLFTNTKLSTTYHAPGATTNNPTPSGGTISDGYSVMADEYLRLLLQARTTMDKKFVPQQDRTLVVSPEIEFVLLQSKRLTQSALGADDIASQSLRQAVVGSLYGMNVVVAQGLPAYSSFLIHRTAFVLTTIAPRVPDQAPFGATNSEAGFAMRWVKDYDAQYMIDRSVFSLYTGSTSVNDGGSYGVAADANKNVRAVFIDGTSFSLSS